MNRFIYFFTLLSSLFLSSLHAVETVDLDIISYRDFVLHDERAINTLKRALLLKGIVGIRNVPGYREKVDHLIEAARAFSALPESIKIKYAPNRSAGEIAGYELGKEKFQLSNGAWVTDTLKTSYYGFVPENPSNKWPSESNLAGPFQDLGMLMSKTAEEVMQKIGLLAPKTPIDLTGTPRVGRMLHYRQNKEDSSNNPLWCGAHFDHGIFTALVPAIYFKDGKQIPEPAEAGLYVKTTQDGVFKKVEANDRDVLLFQVGEFGQLMTDDRIRATEHRVNKAFGEIERFTMALFISAPMDCVIHSYSELTKDARYGGNPGDPCSFDHWQDESYKRYLADDS